MARYLLLFALFQCISCGPKLAVKTAYEEFGIQGETIAILKISDRKWLLKDARPINLTKEEYQDIDSLLEVCITDRNKLVRQPRKSLTDSEFCLLSLPLYKRQYIAYKDAKGDRMVWVNCFYDSSGFLSNWQHKVVFVMDGGNNFFNVKINLSRRSYYELAINSYG